MTRSTSSAIRWDGGDALCGKCAGCECYTFKARRIFKCKACGSQFSVASGTTFASRKMDLRDILAAIAIFVNGAKGQRAPSRDLDCQYNNRVCPLPHNQGGPAG